MGRSFRRAAVPLQSMVERPRLVRTLRRRFDVAVTTVVAGPGFGKSVLLSQALNDNRATPRGHDLFLSCEPGDAHTTSLLGDLAEVAGVDLRGDDGTDLLLPLAQRWPGGLCIVLDDVHLVPEGSAGRSLLAQMVADPPPGISFLLASRDPISGLSRLRAQGRTLELGERDLAFVAEEVPDLDPSTTDELGGWPALVSLTRSFDLDVAREFVTEELIETLSPPVVEALAVLSVIGGADEELAGAVLSAPLDRVAMSRVPLVHDDGPHVVVHAIWAGLLGDHLPPARVAEVHRRVGQVLLDRDETVRAGESFVAGGDSEGLRRCVRSACSGGFAATPTDVLGSWWDALDDGGRHAAEGRLLEALLLRASEPYSLRCRETLEEAVAAARDVGDVGLEITAMWEYGFVLRGRGEMDLMLHHVPRAAELGSSDRRAAPLASLAQSLVSEALGDHAAAEAAMAAVDRSAVPAGWRPSIEFMQTVFAYRRGDVDAVERSAAAFLEVAPADFPARSLFAPWMEWVRGTPPMLDGLAAPGDLPGSTTADRVWTCPSFGIILANAGLVETARRAVGDGEAAAVGLVLPSTRALVAAAVAALRLADGDEAGAAEALAGLAASPESAALHERALRQVLPIGYVLAPELRRHWDADAELGPLHEATRELGRCVAAVRDGSVPPVPSPGALRHVATALPLRWAVELACATALVDPRVAREMVEVLVDAHGERTRQSLRVGREADNVAVRKGAKQLLGSVPIRSAGVELHVLGPTEMVVGGEVVTDPDWRRAKVRAVACLMAVRRSIRRDEVVELLWPDLDLEPARHNLRVTLNYLQRLFDPDRRAGEAPFHLRMEGEWLVLLGAPHVRVDAEEFAALADRADRRRLDGDLSGAVDDYRAALTLWRGDCLSDAEGEEWARSHCSRLVGRGAEAGVALSSLLLALGDPAGASEAAYVTLGIDRWCEPAYRLIVASHLARGDRPAAQRALDQCLAVLDDLGVPPTAETAALQRRVAGAG
jgi:LuxR family transcriptional regulator, maltose regulon positive regulatory protein